MENLQNYGNLIGKNKLEDQKTIDFEKPYCKSNQYEKRAVSPSVTITDMKKANFSPKFQIFTKDEWTKANKMEERGHDKSITPNATYSNHPHHQPCTSHQIPHSPTLVGAPHSTLPPGIQPYTTQRPPSHTTATSATMVNDSSVSIRE